MRATWWRLALVAVSFFSGLPASGAATPAITADPGQSLEVRLTIGQSTYVFDSRRAKDLGDYVGPGFVQRNLEARERNIPLTVLFRPDRGSDRIEVVVEWGDAVRNEARHLGPYVATISKGGNTVAEVALPEHYWLSRWRWQSEPRPIVRSPKNLIADRLVPPYSNIATVAPPATAPTYSVMGLSDVTDYMPTSGERADIGLMPERYAAYLATGDQRYLASIFAWAESSGTIPWHLRDTAKHAPLSYDDHPEASTYDNQAIAGGKPRFYFLPAGKISIDGAHQPALAYLPFLLTGDPYYLEELQFAATYTLGDYPHHGGIIRHDQAREFAWTLRTLFYLSSGTPDQVPSWLLPKSYWQSILQRNRRWVMLNYVNKPGAKTALFQSGVDAERMPFWQEDYFAAVLGVGVWMGHADWSPVLAWKIKSTIARTDGRSGWPRAHPTFYLAEFKRPDGKVVGDWASLAMLNKLDPTENEALDSKTDGNYVAFARAALAMAVTNNISEAVQPYQWLDGEIRQKYIPWRWAIEPDKHR